MLSPGRIVLKIAGREAGKYAVIIESPKNGFVTITGPKTITGVKRRKCSITHVEPTEHLLKAGTDEILEKEWKSSGLLEKLNIAVPEKHAKKAVRPKKENK